MANELPNALKELHKLLSSNLPGLRQAPEQPIEQASAFPFMAIFPGTGKWRPENGGVVGGHNVVVQIHVARKDLPRDMAAVVPYGDLVKDIIYAGDFSQNYNLNGTVNDVASTEIDYTFGGLEWGGVQTLGWSFVLPMHIQSVWNSSEGTYVKG